MCDIVQKYNVPGPRYTSYPTVPYWNLNTFSGKKWEDSVKRSFDTSNSVEGISLYIHLPFCESICTFCGCHKRITKRHDVEIPYVKSILKEWKLYSDLFSEKPIVKELHLGGGTPTFFSPENLKFLIDGIFRWADKAKITNSVLKDIQIIQQKNICRLYMIRVLDASVMACKIIMRLCKRRFIVYSLSKM